MELNISDLLDDLQEVDVDIHPHTMASANRIKELTMKKIHNNHQQRPRRGLSTLGRLALAAAIIAALAIPVMAATGFLFTDWLEGLETESQEDYNVRYSTWEETEGFWQVDLTAKDLTREGMTLVCREVQDSSVTGSLMIRGGFRLEQWNGEAFVSIGESAAGESREIKDLDCFEETITWSDICGPLESGRYRLLKSFTYTFSDGSTAELTDWAEFRIFNEDMTPYIDRCKDALEELRNREASYVEYSRYIGDAATAEVWRSGEDYLLRDTMEFNGNSFLWGSMVMDGAGYEINSWNGEDILSGAAEWEYDNLVALPDLKSTFETWFYAFSLEETLVGEIWAEENEIVILTGTQNYFDYPYKEYTYRFDETGKLTGGEINYLPEAWCEESEKCLSCTMVVHDISAGEAAQVFTAQNVGVPDSFSWAEEREEHLASMTGVKTEGFVNTAPEAIENGYDAFMRSFNDYEVVAGTHHASHVSYDAQADMWRVEFWWKNGNVNAIIYMDGDGITRMTVMKPYEQ